jgi:hypothetical protein
MLWLRTLELYQSPVLQSHPLPQILQLAYCPLNDLTPENRQQAPKVILINSLCTAIELDSYRFLLLTPSPDNSC